MSEAKLGQLIDEAAERDAIHIAIVPLIAGDYLRPAEKIKLKYGSTEIALSAEYDEKRAIGIVDPFLPGYEVEKGKRFYGCLFPGTVTGMRHHWQHPLFDNRPKVELNEHEVWLKNFCDQWNFDYDQLIDAGVGTGEWRYVVANGVDLHSRGELGSDYEEFWTHLEGLTGKTFDNEHREGMGWSCTC